MVGKPDGNPDSAQCSFVKRPSARNASDLHTLVSPSGCDTETAKCSAWCSHQSARHGDTTLEELQVQAASDRSVIFSPGQDCKCIFSFQDTHGKTKRSREFTIRGRKSALGSRWSLPAHRTTTRVRGCEPQQSTHSTADMLMSQDFPSSQIRTAICSEMQ